MTKKQLYIVVVTTRGEVSIHWGDAPEEAQKFIMACMDGEWDSREIPDTVSESLLHLLPVEDIECVHSVRYQFKPIDMP